MFTHKAQIIPTVAHKLIQRLLGHLLQMPMLSGIFPDQHASEGLDTPLNIEYLPSTEDLSNEREGILH